MFVFKAAAKQLGLMLMLRNKEIEGDSTVSCKLMEYHLRFCNVMSELLLHIQVGRPCPTGKVELA
jgi:hypothetical protein